MKLNKLEKDLEKILKSMERMIDKQGMREDFEKFKEENKDKSLDEMLEELKETMLKEYKPEFKILLETDKDGEGYHIEVHGSKISLMTALAELSTNLILESTLTEEDLKFAIERGIKTANEEE